MVNVKSHYPLILILLIGLFFRTYAVVERYDFAHDHDLFSWIVKDIVVDGHPRLIGQLTSAPGIFIGPLFYYSLIPFFLLLNMDPVGAIIPITITGILTIISYYFVFSKLFNKKVGLIIAFLYATLLSTVGLDRRVAPSTYTNLWVIWYFYTVVNLSRGNYFVLPILGVLLGLIWHIHIALLPALTAVPFAFVFSKKLPDVKNIIKFFITLFITSTPLIIFEMKHGFIQTVSLINNFTVSHSGEIGFSKLNQVLQMITKNLNSLFFAPQYIDFTHNVLFLILFLSFSIFLIRKRLILAKEFAVFLFWIIGVVLFFSLSSSPISEYYFANIEIIFLTLASLFLYFLYKTSNLGKYFVLTLLSLILIKNAFFLVTQDFYKKGYNERKAIVDFIFKDAKKKNYPCAGITYITSPGENVGFRYFFYLKDLKIKHPSYDLPVYNIVIPEELSKETEQKFGHVGLITPDPKKLPTPDLIDQNCQGENTNLTDLMFGFTR